MILIHDGQPVTATTALLSPLGEGFQFGVGVFTTLRVADGRAQFPREHFERLHTDAATLGLDAPCSFTDWCERCHRAVQVNSIMHGGLKIIWHADGMPQVREWIFPRTHAYTDELKARGLALRSQICSTRSGDSLARHKTLNYLHHWQAKRAAVAAGLDDALWIDVDGRVLEGATCTLFLVQAGVVSTPPLEDGVLPGVLRRVLLERCSLKITTRTLGRSDLERADEVFVTNSLMGVMPVRKIDQQEWSATDRTVTTRLAAEIEHLCNRHHESPVCKS